MVKPGNRIGSMVIDHILMSVIVLFFSLPLCDNIISNHTYGHYQSETIDSTTSFYIFIFGFSLYVCKDSIKGRSIAKLFLNHEIIDTKTGLVASPIKCMVRNLFIIIWPVEVIMVLINPSSRIGDKVAGTEVTIHDKLKPKQKFNAPEFLFSILLAATFIYVTLLPFKPLSSEKFYLSKSDEIYFNKAKSDALSKIFRDSLGDYLTPDIRVFNKTASEEKTIISAILYLKKNYLEDPAKYNQLKERCDYLFNSKHKEPFTGRVYFVRKNITRHKFISVKIENKSHSPVSADLHTYSISLN